MGSQASGKMRKSSEAKTQPTKTRSLHRRRANPKTTSRTAKGQRPLARGERKPLLSDEREKGGGTETDDLSEEEGEDAENDNDEEVGEGGDREEEEEEEEEKEGEAEDKETEDKEAEDEEV